ncbi:hypothetical protein ACSZMK_11010, partial [Aeromonas caviae]
MASLLDAGGRDQRRVVPQAQTLGQVVAGHRREGYAGHQGAQPRQACTVSTLTTRPTAPRS